MDFECVWGGPETDGGCPSYGGGGAEAGGVLRMVIGFVRTMEVVVRMVVGEARRVLG